MSNAALLSHFPRSIRLIVVWLVPSRRASSYCESPSCLRIALNCAAKSSWSLTSGTTLSGATGATGSDIVATVDYHSRAGGMRTYEGRTPLVE